MDKYVAINITKDELEEAHGALLSMIKVFPPWFRKMNFDGRGKEDERDCKRHLDIASRACLSLLAVIDSVEQNGRADHAEH